MFYDKFGKEITEKEWKILRNNIEYWNIKKTKIKHSEISTVWIGVNFPFVYETMVFGGKHAGYIIRAKDTEEALKNHEKTVDMVKNNFKNDLSEKDRKLVILESPYNGDLERNINYAQLCVRDSIINYNENPYASHIFFTQKNILDDSNEKERELGIDLGFSWGQFAKKTVVYCDYGISKGMKLGIEEAKKRGRIIEYRLLYKEKDEKK